MAPEGVIVTIEAEVERWEAVLHRSESELAQVEEAIKSVPDGVYKWTLVLDTESAETE